MQFALEQLLVEHFPVVGVHELLSLVPGFFVQLISMNAEDRELALSLFLLVGKQ